MPLPDSLSKYLSLHLLFCMSSLTLLTTTPANRTPMCLKSARPFFYISKPAFTSPCHTEGRNTITHSSTSPPLSHLLSISPLSRLLSLSPPLSHLLSISPPLSRSPPLLSLTSFLSKPPNSPTMPQAHRKRGCRAQAAPLRAPSPRIHSFHFIAKPAPASPCPTAGRNAQLYLTSFLSQSPL